MWSRPERRREFLSVLLGLLALVQVQLAIVVRIDRIEFAVASVVFLVIATAVVAVRRLRDFRFALIAAAYCFRGVALLPQSLCQAPQIFRESLPGCLVRYGCMFAGGGKNGVNDVVKRSPNGKSALLLVEVFLD